MAEKNVPKTNGSHTFSVDGATITVSFPANPNADFVVVTKDLPSSGLPSGYTWLISFGIKKGKNFLPSVSYDLDVTDPSNRNWFVAYGGSAHALKGSHTSPGDPPVGTG